MNNTRVGETLPLPGSGPRKWVLVEDNEMKVRAYFKAFEQWRNTATDSPQLHVLFVPQSNVTFVEVLDAVSIPLWCSYSTVVEDKCLRCRADELAKGSSPLIIILDALLEAHGQTVIQTPESAKEIWSTIESRSLDDLLVMVTTKALIDDMCSAFPRTGAPGRILAADAHPAVMIEHARASIAEADQQWRDRYDRPGIHLVRGLIAARSLGEGGHINNFEEVPYAFPLRSALTEDTSNVSAFKAVYYYETTPRRPDESQSKYAACLSTIARLLRACGIPCSVSGDGNAQVGLPVSPGAVFLFHLCYLYRVLCDCSHGNPVRRIQLADSAGALSVRCEFDGPIATLETAVKNGKKQHGTEGWLRGLSGIRPLFPAGNGVLQKVAESAAEGVVPTVAEFVRTTEPVAVYADVNNPVASIKWEEKAFTIESTHQEGQA